MDELGRNQRVGNDLASKSRLALAAALVSAVLAACGGDSDSPAAAAPTVSGDTSTPSAAALPSSGAAPATSAGAPLASGNAPSTSAGVPPTLGDASATSGSTPPTSGGTPPSTNAGLTGVGTATGSTTLSWTPPTLNDDGTPAKLTGYRLYWGLTEGNYSHSVTLDNPGLTRYVVEQLAPATWYFAATALSIDAESEFSNVVAMDIR